MSFSVPVKRIGTKAHLEEFLKSNAYEEYIRYIERLNEAVKNLKIETELELSKVNLDCARSWTWKTEYIVLYRMLNEF